MLFMRCKASARMLVVLTTFFSACLAAASASAEKRIAFIVGNAAYQHATVLANPANDASDMAAALRELDFHVMLGIDLTKREFDELTRTFSQALADADTALFFYAGHGLQVSGRNYLVPVDAQLKSERDLDFDAVSLDFLLKQMELGRDNKTNIVFLDACRDNPLARNLARTMGTRSASVGQGLAEVQTGVGTFVAYSTQPGNVALDGSGRNSPFTAALAKTVKEPGKNLTAVMIDVRKQVLTETGGKQVPWDHSALVGEFFFRGGTPSNAEPAAAAAAFQKRTLDLVKIENLKERERQLVEANRDDQMKLFETQRSGEARDVINRQVGKIQLQMVRRGQELQRVRDEMATLEAGGEPAPSDAAPKN